MRRSLVALALALVLPLPVWAGQVTVKEGETLSEIAERYGLSVNQLMKLNGLGNADHVEAGQTLTVPSAAGSRSGAGARASVRVTVQDGDTLSEIADRHGMSVSQLMKLNGLGNADHVETGQTLLVYGPSKPAATASYRKGASEHVVRPGESLSVIAAGYGIGMGKLVALNGISDPDQVEAGTRLKLKGSPPVVKPASPRPATSKPANAKPVSQAVAAKPVPPGPKPAAPKPKPVITASRPVAATPTAVTPAKAEPQPEIKATAPTNQPAVISTRPSATVTSTAVSPTTAASVEAAVKPSPTISPAKPSSSTASTIATASRTNQSPSSTTSRVTTSAAATSTTPASVEAAKPSTTTIAATSSPSQTPISSRFSPRPTTTSPTPTSTAVAASTTAAASTAVARTAVAANSTVAANANQPVSTPVTRPASSRPVAMVAPSPRATTRAATTVAKGSGKPDWRTYGPLQIDWSGWQPMGGSMVAPTLNAQGQSLYLAINCGARKLNATTPNGDWKTWDDPSADFELQLVNDYCRSRS